MELKSFNEMVRKEMNFGLNHCDITLQNFVASSKQHLAKVEVKKACEIIDRDMRCKNDPRQKQDTLDELRAMYKDFFTISTANQKAVMGSAKVMTQQMVERSMFARKQLEDFLFVKYGILKHQFDFEVDNKKMDKDA